MDARFFSAESFRVPDTPKHCLLAPSSAYRWLNCPGSLNAPPDADTQDTAHTREGTVAHARAAEFLGGESIPAEVAEWMADLSDEAFDEMTEHIKGFVEFVRSVPGRVSVEMNLLSGIVAEFGGTLDVLVQHPAAMHVIDFKYGFQRVGVEQNRQIMSYLCLAREHYGRAPVYRGTIYQPRIDYVATAEWTDAELDAHMVEVIEAYWSRSEYKAGEWCRYCPLLPTCETALARAREIAQTEFGEIVTSDESTLNRLTTVMEFGSVAAAMAKSAEDKLLEIALAGTKIPGYGLTNGRGRRAWKDEDETVTKLKAAGVPDEKMFSPPALLSPAQMEKKVSRKLVGELTTKTPGKWVLKKQELLECQTDAGDEFDTCG